VKVRNLAQRLEQRPTIGGLKTKEYILQTSSVHSWVTKHLGTEKGGGDSLNSELREGLLQIDQEKGLRKKGDDLSSLLFISRGGGRSVKSARGGGWGGGADFER